MANIRFKVWEFTEHFYPIRIFFAPTAKDWKGLLINQGVIHDLKSAERNPYPDDKGARVTTFDTPNAPGFIAVITVSDRAEEYDATMLVGMLVHELTHVKQFAERQMFGKNHGDTDSRMDNESEAYLMHSMVMWLLDAYAKSGRGFKD